MNREVYLCCGRQTTSSLECPYCRKEIKFNGETYAILIPNKDIKSNTEWFGDPSESLQISRMSYKDGKTFKTHHHILNPRIIRRTQEAFIVIAGSLTVDVYAKDAFIGTLTANPSEAIVVYRGGHKVTVSKDSIAYEVKAGSFSVVSEDKEFLDD